MMNYETFKGIVVEKFKDYLPKEYQGMELSIHTVEKVNVRMEGIILIDNCNAITAKCIIYINEMYDHYKQCSDLQEVLQLAARRMGHAIIEAPKVDSAIDFNDAKDNIVFQLINTEQNKQILSDIPHREFEDLTIIYHLVLKMEADGISSTVISSALAERLRLSEEQMFQLAVENTKRIFPPEICHINDIVREMFIKDGMPAEMADIMIEEVPAEMSLWVVSNNKRINGAIAMLYEDIFHTLAERLETNLYIMPSSIHEVIAVSVSSLDPNDLAEMVAEINMKQVALEERLSNQVYHYDKDLRKLSRATDTPHKRLD